MTRTSVLAFLLATVAASAYAAPYYSYPTGSAPTGSETVGPIHQGGVDVTMPLNTIAGQTPFASNSASVAQPSSTRFARLGIVPDDYYQLADGNDDAPEISRANAAACSGQLQVTFIGETYPMRTPITGFCYGLRWKGAGWTDTPSVGVNTILADYMTSTTVSPISIVTEQSVRIEDMAFTEPNQPVPNATAVAAWTPVALAPVITAFNSTGIYLHHLMFDGVYQGISADLSGRATIDDIYGQGFNGLVQVHHSYDSDHIGLIHDWPYWSSNSNVLAYTEQHEDTLLIGREDTAFIGDIFSFASNQGIQFAYDAAGASYNGTTVAAANAPSGVSTADHIHTVSCDGTVTCVYVAGSGVVANIEQIRTQSQNYGLSFAPSNGAVQTLAQGSAIFVGPSGWANLLHVDDVTTYQNLTPIILTNTGSCSNIQIGVAFHDFLYAGSNPSLVNAAPCDGTAAYNSVGYGSTPQTQNISGTITTEPAGATRGVTVSIPTVTTTY